MGTPSTARDSGDIPYSTAIYPKLSLTIFRRRMERKKIPVRVEMMNTLRQIPDTVSAASSH
jgi:hypothetical protein